jgi:hypothetical protein
MPGCREDSAVKTILRILVSIMALAWLLACAGKEDIYDGICHGLYDASVQAQQNKDPESVPPPGKEPPSYEQYKRERDAMLKGREESSFTP